jgi:microcystin-dependent protein
MMARTAEWRDDISGTITTTNTSTAYNLASNQIFTSLAVMGGAMLAFVPHITNGAGSPSVTLNVDGLGAKPVRSSPAVEIGAGTLIQGTPYVVTYNAADAAFYLQGFTGNPYNVPVGGLLPYLGGAAPPNSNFVYPVGQQISRTTYVSLFNIVGTAYGPGDGTTTFNVPDLRGRSVFALDNMGGSVAGVFGTVVTDTGTMNGALPGSKGGSTTHVMTSTEMPVHNHGVNESPHTHSLDTGNGTGVYKSNARGAGPGATLSFNNESAGVCTMGSASTGISIQANGSSAAFAIISPAIILPYILRVI